MMKNIHTFSKTKKLIFHDAKYREIDTQKSIKHV